MDTIFYMWLALISTVVVATSGLLLRIGLNCVYVERKLNREIDAIWGDR